MTAPHPIHALRTNLETKRLELVEKLSAGGTLSADVLRDVAVVQTALMAVREAIETHGPKVGWGSGKELE
jgi:hypothetical protein